MLDIQLPKIERVASSENYARYTIEPMERGFGMTLGNALRRVLLSSLPGAAVASVKIDGIFHEFSHLPHVREDTTELLLNIKQIRMRSFSDYPVRLSLEARGVGQVTAADITCPPEVEIVNPDLHIASLDSDEARVSMELTVERGRGFIPADSRDSGTIGVIPVDAIFTPVRRVNFTVENTRVGHQTDFDSLILEVWTDGTITPDDAVSESAQVLVQHLELVASLGGKSLARAARTQLGAGAIPVGAYNMPIEELELSVRAYNCLKRANISKVGQILEMSDDEILAVRNFGRKSLDELREKLAARGFERPAPAVSEMEPLAEVEEEEPSIEEVETEELAAVAEEMEELTPAVESETAATPTAVVIEEAEPEAAPVAAYEPSSVRPEVPVIEEDEEDRPKRRRPRPQRRGRRRDEIIDEMDEGEYNQ